MRKKLYNWQIILSSIESLFLHFLKQEMGENTVLIPETNVSLYKVWAMLIDIIFMLGDREKKHLGRGFCVWFISFFVYLFQEMAEFKNHSKQAST